MREGFGRINFEGGYEWIVEVVHFIWNMKRVVSEYVDC